MIKAVVFDLDETLVKFNLHYKSLRAEARDLLIRQGVHASVLSINESIFSMLKKTEIFMKNNGKKEKDLEEVYKGIWSLTEKYELEAAKSTNLVPGATEVLKKLQNWLMHHKQRKKLGYILKKFKIEGFFNAVTPRDHVKPDVEHLEATLKALEVKPEEALMVGDSPIDMECAKNLEPSQQASPQEFPNPKNSWMLEPTT